MYDNSTPPICWIPVLVFLIFSGVFAAVIYRKKGRSQLVGFLLGFLLGPIGVIVAQLSSASVEGQASQGQLKKCPFCGEFIKPEATVCRFCTRELPPLT